MKVGAGPLEAEEMGSPAELVRTAVGRRIGSGCDPGIAEREGCKIGIEAGEKCSRMGLGLQSNLGDRRLYRCCMTCRMVLRGREEVYK